MPSNEEAGWLCWRRRRWQGAGACYTPEEVFQSCPLLLCHHQEATSSLPADLFLKFLSQRSCQGRGTIKSSPPCHECTRSSRACGQNILAISSGHDLCFDHGRGGFQSIKPWPALHWGWGRRLPLTGEGDASLQSTRTLLCPSGLDKRLEGTLLLAGYSARETALHVPYDMLLP